MVGRERLCLAQIKRRWECHPIAIRLCQSKGDENLKTLIGYGFFDSSVKNQIPRTLIPLQCFANFQLDNHLLTMP